jgi:endo-1,4-beta-xylanase
MGFSTIGRKLVRLGSYSQETPAPLNSPSLDTLAQAVGIRYGCSVDSSKLGYADYIKYLPNECGIFTTEWEFNYNHVEPSQGTYSFSTTDPAVNNITTTWGKLCRGHIIVDGGGGFLPAWLTGGTWTPTSLTTVLQNHIAAVVGRYAGRIHSYDGVNEALKPFTGTLTGGWQSNFWTTQLGIGTNGVPNYIGIVHNAIRAADSAAKIVLNVNQIETSTSFHKLQKTQVLAAIATMQAAGIPIDALGIEAHLAPTFLNDFVQADWVNFLNAVQALGLAVYITELDVDDSQQSANQATRDAQDAAIYAAFMTPTAAHSATEVVQNWQLADRDSWYRFPNFGAQRADHLELRPDLLDGAYRIKPAYTAVANAFIAALVVATPPPPGTPPQLSVRGAPTITFVDSIGQVTMTALVPTLNNWMPNHDDPGTQAVGLGTGLVEKWVYRNDYTAEFDFYCVFAGNMAQAMRLRAFLRGGGTCVLNTNDNQNRTYTCALKPDGDVSWKYDRVLRDYTLHMQLKNMTQVEMICDYAGT